MFAFEGVKGGPERGEVVGSKEEAPDLLTLVIGDEARIAQRRAPPLRVQPAAHERRLPRSAKRHQHVFVGPARRQRAIDE